MSSNVSQQLMYRTVDNLSSIELNKQSLLTSHGFK